MKPKFEIGDLVEHTELNALGLVVDLDGDGDPIIEIVKLGSRSSPYVKEGTKAPFYPHYWKRTEE